MTEPKRPRLIAAIPIDPPRKPTRPRKLKQQKQIQAWRRHAEKPAETGDKKGSTET